MKNLNRRNFLKKSSVTAATVATASFLTNYAEARPPRKAVASYMGDFSASKIPNIRAAFIGVGARGPGHLKFFAGLEGTEVVAISDLYEDLAIKSNKSAEGIGKGNRHKNIKIYHGGEDRWKVMLKEVKPDVVFIATNWQNHAPMAIEVMKSGAHAFVEVPIALTLEEMWEVVDTSETTQKHCMMMENVNYSRDELMFLNMCRQGVIG
jgi:predicted dehydrogenase